MVSIHSDEEHDFVVVGLNEDDFPWLGGKRAPFNHDKFVWSDGTPWDYTNWAQGQPDDFKSIEDCAHLWEADQEGELPVSQRHKWNDRPCSHVRSFVCKRKQI